MAIRKDIDVELTAWMTARRALTVAKRMAGDRPEDGARKARVDQATADVREAVSILRAALDARGYSLAELQAELRVSN